jgi:propane monooxygenase small subunit
MAETKENVEKTGVGRPPGGAARGAAKFPSSDSRKFNYFEPKGRRPSLYESMTVDVLPDPERHLLQGWIIEFADGHEAYDKRRTKLKSSDWHAYRAPDGEWERNHYQRQTDVETMIKQIVERGRTAKAPQGFDKMWRPILEKHLGALKHAEFGLHYATMSGQRDGVTQMINNSILTNASHKIRLAQDLVLYLAEIAQDIDIDLEAGKKAWIEDPAWQGARKIVENIMAGPDYLEQYFAINLVCEPMVTEALRSGLFMQFSAAHSDFLTPAVLSAAENDYDRDLANAIEMFNLLANDSEYGAENQKTLQQWLEKYVPMAVEAIEQLQPLWSQPRVKRIPFLDVYEQAKERMMTALEEINVTLPSGVNV